MLNIVIPIAGKGSRFVSAGYEMPKPLIEVHGTPMTELVINNLKPSGEHRFIFLCLQEHITKYQIDEKIKQWSPNAIIITVDQVTQGAACTVLLAKEYINNKDGLMIANCDQFVDIDINDYLNAFEKSGHDGYIMTLKANDPKWSYIRLNKKEEIDFVVEKQVVSDEATVGIYNYKEGRMFVEAAEKMIADKEMTNEEYYVAPAYNKMIEKGLTIGYYNIGSEMDGMYGIGIPSDLETFLKLDVSKKAVSFNKKQE